MDVTPLEIFWSIPSTARAVAYSLVHDGSHMGPIYGLSNRVVCVALEGMSWECLIMGHYQYTLPEQRR